MKKLNYIIILFLILSVKILADWGFYYADRSWIGINFDGVNTAYKLFDNGTVSGSGYFNGSFLGSFSSPGQTLDISFWDIKTYKNSGSDVQQAELWYSIFEQGNPFVVTGGMSTGKWLADLGGGNQKWGQDNSTPIDISSLLPGKTYILDVYIKVYGTSPNEWKYDDNGGSNFRATFTTDQAFPIELVSLNAKANLNKVIIIWQTATEVNNYGFDVEKSLTPTPFQREGAFKWEMIGFVNGHGNSNSLKNYSFTDKDVLSGSYSYRLKQIDTDGKYKYSPTVEVTIDNLPTQFKLSQNYPNPFNPSTVICYTLASKEFVQLKVFNVLGNEIATLVNEVQDAGNYKVEFNPGSSIQYPATGVYFYRLEADSFVESRKMTLVK